ncbi:sensor histidine kinase [Plantactinospora sp. GCM10030261]|uniref:sensor histidine kinase n=1 Tax=Plantactinospora sp. GCM10030261 TaxID=3273420 RepID=UPI0036174D24
MPPATRATSDTSPGQRASRPDQPDQPASGPDQPESRPDHPDRGPTDRPAQAALGRVLAIFSAAVHGSSGLACATAALAVRTPPVDVPLLIPAIAVLTSWSAVFVVRVLRRGMTAWLIGVDVLLTTATCLLIGRLVSAEVLPGEGSWVAIMASTTVLIAQLGIAARWSVPAGLLVVVSYALGAHLAGNDTEATAHALTLTMQVASGAGLAWLARRSSSSADAAFAGYQRAHRQAVVDRATRAAERRQNRDLHDTVLSTLTVVGLGAVRSGQALRDRAATDLRTLDDLADARAESVTTDSARGVRLDDRLRAALAGRPGPPASLPSVTTPPAVAAALTNAVREALSNVDRHAPGSAVEISLSRAANAVVVEVADDGPGFDPSGVPTHRYGLRESVYGRLAAVGGAALVDSSPGHGTRVRLTWPAGGAPAATGPEDNSATVGATVAATADRGVRIAAVVIAFGWHLAINLPALLGSWSAYRWPWIAATAFLAFAAVGWVSARAMLRDERRSVWPPVTVLLATDAAIFACVPPDRLFAPASWGWTSLGWFVALIFWRRRVAALIGALAAGAGIALVALLAAGATREADLSRYGLYVYGTMVLPIALVVGAGMLSSLATSTAGTAAARSALAAERTAAARTRRERRERLSVVSVTAGVVLAELADGRADPADPRVQRRCALAASRLRRLIAESDDVPDPLLHELRACADIAERGGVPVEFVSVGELPPLPVEIRRRLVDPLAATLAAARGWARLTVVGQPNEVVVGVTTAAGPEPVPPEAPPTPNDPPSGPDRPAGGYDGRVERFHERDEEMIWAQTRWRAR